MGIVFLFSEHKVYVKCCNNGVLYACVSEYVNPQTILPIEHRFGEYLTDRCRNNCVDFRKNRPRIMYLIKFKPFKNHFATDSIVKKKKTKEM